MRRIILSIPPDYDRNFPPLGTPALAAFLEDNGVGCAQIDLNIGYRDFLAKGLNVPGGTAPAAWNFLLHAALNKFFTENCSGRYYSQMLERDNASELPRLPYDNNTNSSFHFCERLLSSEYLWRYLEDDTENTFLRFYKEIDIAALVKAGKTRLFCISVTSPTQALASLTLGLLLKKTFPDIHVNIGGQWATLFRRQILERKDLFRCFDSIIAFEGESALLGLARAVESGRDVPDMRNIFTRDFAVSAVERPAEEDMDLLPCPNFLGLPLEKYDGSADGDVSLTYETSRGCYWSKCAYCVDLPLPKPSYRAKDPRLVARDVETLIRRHSATYLLFGDPGLSPRQMIGISRAILSSGARIRWWTMARLDPGFTPEVFGLAKKAGLSQVNFGFESSNDHVCDLLDKGNRRERSSRVIKDCAGAGISVDLQTMLALPGEKFEDALDTVDFLVAHKKYISHVTFNTYYLTPFNHVYNDPARYGIEYDKELALPFAFFIPFRNAKGMDPARAELVEKICYSLFARARRMGEEPTVSGRTPSEHTAEFTMNGRSTSLRYIHNGPTDEYVVQDDEEGAIDAGIAQAA
jgi:radical SAM superfamily enzyme YgiQ (UPF0313 family)